MWLLPSRRRPYNLARFFAACRASGVATEGTVLVDRRDWNDNRLDYEACDPPAGWRFRLTEGETQGDKVREVWPEIADRAWLGLIGDDCVPETAGWDRRLVEHLEPALIVSCEDGWQAPQRLGNCWIIAGALARRVGYIFPPGLQHLFVDDIWEAIGRGADCWHRDMTVKVAHRHVQKGEAPPDETYRAIYGDGFTTPDAGPDMKNGFWAGDEAVFSAWETGPESSRCIEAARSLRPGRSEAPASSLA